LSRRFPQAADLERLHRALGAQLSPWRRALARLRATAGGLEWLRRAELTLARAYTSRQAPGAAAAWQRYLAAEHLVAMAEFGEPSPA
jgi:hypothetical protein